MDERGVDVANEMVIKTRDRKHRLWRAGEPNTDTNLFDDESETDLSDSTIEINVRTDFG